MSPGLFPRLLVFSSCLATAWLEAPPPKNIDIPPKITLEPSSDVIFKPTERLELPCRAKGHPPPEYTWLKNGKKLRMMDGMKQEPGSGTLIFPSPLSTLEGEYQCQAHNKLGTALTVKTRLHAATLHPFPSVSSPKEHRPRVGDSLKLKCTPPKSVPKAVISWGTPLQDTQGTGAIITLKTSKRIAQDSAGDLYFANVDLSDEKEGRIYYCQAFGQMLNVVVRGNDMKITPQKITITPPYKAPEVMWTSDLITTAVMDEVNKTMKCIFSGYPTPNVTWEKIGGDLPGDVKIRDFGRELVFPKITIDHHGEYQCKASNHNQKVAVTKKFTLTIDRKPFWIVKPEDVMTAEEEDASFTCKVGGTPKPEVKWFINGQPIKSLKEDTRRKLVGDKLIFTNLSDTDAAVLQCNASNKHGHIFTNAYLNVLAEPPSITVSPKLRNTVALGKNRIIECGVWGAPKPEVTWLRNNKSVIGQRRFTLLRNGSLLIETVEREDEGTYTCHAKNKFGTISAAGGLYVREPTVITKKPKSANVIAGKDVHFECEATTDVKERANLRITWRRNGTDIDYTHEGRIHMNTDNHTLTIQKAQAADTSMYTCVASNGLDSDEVTAVLVVRDRPDPPYEVTMTTCLSEEAEIAWTPGKDNNDAIEEFEVWYNTSFDSPGHFNFGGKRRRGRNKLTIELSPYVNYTFHVVAVNGVGRSEPSLPAPGQCQTAENVPYKNPDDVCVQNSGKNELIITWKPMPKMDQNGMGFRYFVEYQRLDKENAETHNQTIFDAEESKFVVPVNETFVPFKISVRAANNKGYSPEMQRKEIVGYSGEGKPDVVPENFRLDPLFKPNATAAIFLWNKLDPKDPRLNGHLKGYQIQFWRQDKPHIKRSHIVKPKDHEIELCQSFNRWNGRNGPVRISKRNAENVQVRAHLYNLWPYSKIEAGILVMNTKHSGELGDVILFNTTEAPPGPVGTFNVAEIGSHHVTVNWNRPEEENGELLGYTITCTDKDTGISTEFEVDDPNIHSKKIQPLKNATNYEITIAGRTNAGPGDVKTIHQRTLNLFHPPTVKPPAPDAPHITNIRTGDTSVNVSWAPSKDDPPKNPGTHYYVQYTHKDDRENWTRIDADPDHNWLNVTDLINQEEYMFQVVAVNGIGDESSSDEVPVIVGVNQVPTPTPGETKEVSDSSVEQITEDESTHKVASASWFIIPICIILLLLIILIIICLIKRNRGGKYPVHEKEKLRGKDPEKDELNTPFGEYTRTDTPEKKSQLSLEYDQPLESETDSMAEYYETDPSKFNEDGSFIGQYGGKHSSKEKLAGNDVTSPSALSTFV